MPEPETTDRAEAGAEPTAPLAPVAKNGAAEDALALQRRRARRIAHVLRRALESR